MQHLPGIQIQRFLFILILLPLIVACGDIIGKGYSNSIKQTDEVQETVERLPETGKRVTPSPIETSSLVTLTPLQISGSGTYTNAEILARNGDGAYSDVIAEGIPMTDPILDFAVIPSQETWSEGTGWWITSEGIGRIFIEREGWFPNGWSFFTATDGLPDSEMRALDIDDQERIWIATSNGVIVLSMRDKTRHMTIYTKDNGLVSNDVTDIIVDSGGNIWAGTMMGISRYSNGEWTTINDSPPVKKMIVDQSKRIWVIIPDDEGIGMFDGKTWAIYSKADDFYAIRDLAVNEFGEVWVSTGQCLTWNQCTNVGLSRFEGETWVHFEKTRPSQCDIIQNILFDDDGSVIEDKVAIDIEQFYRVYQQYDKWVRSDYGLTVGQPVVDIAPEHISESDLNKLCGSP